MLQQPDVIVRVRDLAGRVSASHGLEVFDVQFRREGRGMVLRVQIDDGISFLDLLKRVRESTLGAFEHQDAPFDSLVRELQEELGIAATIGGEVYRTKHRYKELHDDLILIFFWATIADSAPLQNLAFERFEWAGPAVLPKYDFLPADKELIALLASGAIRVD